MKQDVNILLLTTLISVYRHIPDCILVADLFRTGGRILATPALNTVSETELTYFVKHKNIMVLVCEVSQFLKQTGFAVCEILRGATYDCVTWI
jgi:hypothetical protein